MTVPAQPNKQTAKTKLVAKLKDNPIVQGFGNTADGFYVLIGKGAQIWRDAIPLEIDGFKVRIKKD